MLALHGIGSDGPASALGAAAVEMDLPIQDIVNDRQRQGDLETRRLISEAHGDRSRRAQCARMPEHVELLLEWPRVGIRIGLEPEPSDERVRGFLTEMMLTAPDVPVARSDSAPFGQTRPDSAHGVALPSVVLSSGRRTQMLISSTVTRSAAERLASTSALLELSTTSQLAN